MCQLVTGRARYQVERIASFRPGLPLTEWDISTERATIEGGLMRRVGKVAILTFVFAAALIALATGSAATSAAWKGVIVANDPARNAVVTASANGVARTLRAATARNLRVGQAVVVQARLLADETYRAQRI